MRKLIVATLILCSPSILAAQSTNPESSGQPASAQPDPNMSGAARSMPQGAATMQNDTPTGKAGMTTGADAHQASSTSTTHARHKHRTSATAPRT